MAKKLNINYFQLVFINEKRARGNYAEAWKQQWN